MLNNVKLSVCTLNRGDESRAIQFAAYELTPSIRLKEVGKFEACLKDIRASNSKLFSFLDKK